MSKNNYALLMLSLLINSNSIMLYALTIRWCDPTLINNASGKDAGAQIDIAVTDANGKSIRSYNIYNGQALTISKGHAQPYTISLTSSRTGSNVSYSFKADDNAQLFIVPCESSLDSGKLAYYIYGTQGPNGENRDDQNYLDAGAWYCNSNWVDHKTPYKKYLSSTTNADCYYCPNSTRGSGSCPTYSMDVGKLTYNHCRTYT